MKSYANSVIWIYRPQRVSVYRENVGLYYTFSGCVNNIDQSNKHNFHPNAQKKIYNQKLNQPLSPATKAHQDQLKYPWKKNNKIHYRYIYIKTPKIHQREHSTTTDWRNSTELAGSLTILLFFFLSSENEKGASQGPPVLLALRLAVYWIGRRVAVNLLLNGRTEGEREREALSMCVCVYTTPPGLRCCLLMGIL